MNKICTDISQSKKLIELGVDVNTADMWWAERYEGRVTENGQYIIAEEPYYYSSLIKPSDINYSQDTINDIPAWSLSALFDLLPEHTRVPSSLKQNKYMCNYHNGIVEFGDDCHKDKSTNLFDAVFEMIVWLKERKYI